MHDLARVLVRNPLPHAQRQRVISVEPLEERQAADPAVLVRDRRVDRGDAARSGELQPLANRRQRLALAVRRLDELLAEEPCGLLAQDAGRLAVLVDLDDAAVGAQVAVRVRERRRVQPHRVPVARGQRGRDVACDRVEHLPCRLDRTATSRRSRQPRPRSQPPGGTDPTAAAHALDRLLERLRPLEAHLVLRERPGDEVDVRVREARKDAAAAEIDDLRRRERRLVRADAAGDAVARDRERPRDRQRGVERPDDSVLEDHAGRI